MFIQYKQPYYQSFFENRIFYMDLKQEKREKKS